MNNDIEFDPCDYAADPESLPPDSVIAKALALGAVFKCDVEKQLWFATHPMVVEAGSTQVQAARSFLARAGR